MVDFYTYVFYRLMAYYNSDNPKENWSHGFNGLVYIFGIHFLTILFYLINIIGLDAVNSIRIEEGIYDEFIVIPIVILPVFLFGILLFFYYKRNKEGIILKIEQYKMEDDKSKRKGGLIVVLYFVLAFLLLLSGIFSSMWFE